MPERATLARWFRHSLTGLAILTLEAVLATSSGVDGHIRAVLGSIAGIYPTGRLFYLPFLLFSVYSMFAASAQHRSPAPKLILLHFICFSSFELLSLRLAHSGSPGRNDILPVLLWVILGLAATATLIALVFPATRLHRSAMLAALAFGGVSVAGYKVSQSFWGASSNATLEASVWLLRHLGLGAGSQGDIVDTGKFSVEILPACSGYEGICMFLVLAVTWLAWFRSEYRFPAALLLLPIGAAVSWCLNVIRIAGLVTIGHFGYADVATGGFHSRAGWIAFTLLAVGFCSLSSRIPVVAALPARQEEKGAETDPIAWFLGPFLAIEFASMISAAASGGFEWLYPLRVLAAAAVFWRYREGIGRALRGDWPSALSAGVGLTAALLWIAVSLRSPFDSGPWAHLDGSSWPVRYGWLLFRVAGAALAAPLAEELAFRGFLMRRIHGENFASIDPRRCGWFSIAVSSIVFGAMHGSRFVEGSCAGALYGWTYSRSGKLIDAVAAHAFTNILLIFAVAVTGDWRYW